MADSFLVGLGRLELPTSPLSGVRSNHLSYRPGCQTGGAGRDRTGDLLNANQALSQLSYSPWIKRCNRGRLDAAADDKHRLPEAIKLLKWRSGTDYGVERLLLT